MQIGRKVPIFHRNNLLHPSQEYSSTLRIDAANTGMITLDYIASHPRTQFIFTTQRFYNLTSYCMLQPHKGAGKKKKLKAQSWKLNNRWYRKKRR